MMKMVVVPDKFFPFFGGHFHPFFTDGFFVKPASIYADRQRLKIFYENAKNFNAPFPILIDDNFPVNDLRFFPDL